MGIYLAIWIKNNYREYKYKYSNKLIPKFTFFSFLGILSCLTLFVYFKRKYNIEYGTLCLPGLIVQIFILPVFISLFYFGLIFEKSILKTILENHLLQIAGVTSYTFYLIHTGQIRSLFEKYVTSNSFILFFMLYATSWILYQTIEEPIRKLVVKKYV
jgi:peptidoglycan/LPS O-acetylase OafA/YrhL